VPPLGAPAFEGQCYRRQSADPLVGVRDAVRDPELGHLDDFVDEALGTADGVASALDRERSDDDDFVIDASDDGDSTDGDEPDALGDERSDGGGANGDVPPDAGSHPQRLIDHEQREDVQGAPLAQLPEHMDFGSAEKPWSFQLAQSPHRAEIGAFLQLARSNGMRARLGSAQWQTQSTVFDTLNLPSDTVSRLLDGAWLNSTCVHQYLDLVASCQSEQTWAVVAPDFAEELLRCGGTMSDERVKKYLDGCAHAYLEAPLPPAVLDGDASACARRQRAAARAPDRPSPHAATL